MIVISDSIYKNKFPEQTKLNYHHEPWAQHEFLALIVVAAFVFVTYKGTWKFVQLEKHKSLDAFTA